MGWDHAHQDTPACCGRGCGAPRLRTTVRRVATNVGNPHPRRASSRIDGRTMLQPSTIRHWVCLPGSPSLPLSCRHRDQLVRDAASQRAGRKPVTPPRPTTMGRCRRGAVSSQRRAQKAIARTSWWRPTFRRCRGSIAGGEHAGLGSHLPRSGDRSLGVVPRHLIDAALAVIGRAPAEGRVPDEEIERVLADGDCARTRKRDPRRR